MRDIQQLLARYSDAVDSCSNNGYDYADLFACGGVTHARQRLAARHLHRDAHLQQPRLDGALFQRIEAPLRRARRWRQEGHAVACLDQEVGLIVDAVVAYRPVVATDGLPRERIPFLNEPWRPAIHLPLADPYQAPEGYVIKANTHSGLYYTPESALYDNTLPEVWFATEELARANGFAKAPE